MSTFIRRYSRYLNEKSFAYRQMSFDFVRVKKGYVCPFHNSFLVLLPVCVWVGPRCVCCTRAWSGWSAEQLNTVSPADKRQKSESGSDRLVQLQTDVPSESVWNSPFLLVGLCQS